ncbi:MAG: hypothetical protein ACK4OM_06645 [Alphaproteobacteria bacterium]
MTNQFNNFSDISFNFAKEFNKIFSSISHKGPEEEPNISPIEIPDEPYLEVNEEERNVIEKRINEYPEELPDSKIDEINGNSPKEFPDNI